MRLKIAARQSDLARIQAFAVAKALQKMHSQLQIEFQFRESLGDRRLDLSLENSPAKGLFTQDFYQDLCSGKCDLVVHSWKDLPVEERPGVEVVATLPRADVRDFLVVKKSSRAKTEWRVLSSSPRRVHNLKETLPAFLPGQPRLHFVPVRGNIPTRMAKLIKSDADALILAKAAVDRLLGAEESEFLSAQQELRQSLSQCDWCVLPLSINPAAAAQGALAIEIATQREDLRGLLQAIQCQQTFQAVSTERNILSNFGGGCQQKIGVTLLDRSYGQLEFIRGLTDQGKILDSCQIRDLELPEEWRSHKEKIFPISSAAGKWFSRVSLLPNELDEIALQKIKGKESSVALWVARAEAFPQSWQNYQFKVVWTSGLKSWQQLAERGIWVHGCSESLGEQENPRIDLVLNHRICWLKLSHVEGFLSGRYDEAESGNQISQEILGTYRLVPENNGPDLKDKTHFYWMSGSSFQQALKNHQEIILQGYHGCGPGNTYKILSQVLPKERLKIFLNYENWRNMTLIG